MVLIGFVFDTRKIYLFLIPEKLERGEQLLERLKKHGDNVNEVQRLAMVISLQQSFHLAIGDVQGYDGSHCKDCKESLLKR